MRKRHESACLQGERGVAEPIRHGNWATTVLRLWKHRPDGSDPNQCEDARAERQARGTDGLAVFVEQRDVHRVTTARKDDGQCAHGHGGKRQRVAHRGRRRRGSSRARVRPSATGRQRGYDAQEGGDGRGRDKTARAYMTQEKGRRPSPTSPELPAARQRSRTRAASPSNMQLTPARESRHAFLSVLIARGDALNGDVTSAKSMYSTTGEPHASARLRVAG